MISISLAENETKKFPQSTLDAYSLKKYKTIYNESKSKVRADVKKLSIKYNTIIPKDITNKNIVENLRLVLRMCLILKRMIG